MKLHSPIVLQTCALTVYHGSLQGQTASGPQNHNPAVKSAIFLGF